MSVPDGVCAPHGHDVVLIYAGRGSYHFIVWDVTSRRQLHRVEVPNKVWSMAFMPPSFAAVSTDIDKSITLHPLPCVSSADCTAQRAPITVAVHDSQVRCMVCPHADSLISGHGNGTIVYHVRCAADRWSVRHTVHGAHTYWVSDLAVTGGVLLSCSCGWFDNVIKLWCVATGTAVSSLRGHTDGVWRQLCVLDGGNVVSYGWDRTLRVWSVARLACVHVVDAASLSVSDLTSYDGGLCGCDSNGRLCVLDAALNVRCRVDVRAALLSDRRCRASLESRWGAHTVETMELDSCRVCRTSSGRLVLHCLYGKLHP